MSKITKSTTLEGYYATGDYECFCFDTHKGPEEHRKVTKGSHTECRVYPDELVPEGTRGKLGRWTITVEFEPYDQQRN